MLTIRKYEEKDYENVCYTCLHSEDDEMCESMCEFVLHTFCEYYIEKEPENCFVLDDDGRAVGYVICAENYDRFQKIFDKEYLPKVFGLGEDRIEWAKTAYILQGKFSSEYPAHLHIDLLPSYQRMGFGGKLLAALFEHLRAKGISGVMLTTGVRNITANNFYKKYGFETLEVVDDDVAFGMKLI